MTDYGEEQRNELEALESIYPDSFTGDFGGRPPWGGGRGPAALTLALQFPGPACSLPHCLEIRRSGWLGGGHEIDPDRLGFA